MEPIKVNVRLYVRQSVHLRRKQWFSLKLFLQEKVYFLVLKKVSGGQLIPGTHISQTALFRDSTFVCWPSNIWLGSSLGVLRIFHVIFVTRAYFFVLSSPLFGFYLLVNHIWPLLVFPHIRARRLCSASISCVISSHLLLSLAQSTAAAAACILPAASYDDGDSTVGAHAGWCWLNGTLHHLKQTHTHTRTVPKILSASRPSNNSSPAITRLRPHRCSG